MLIAFCILEINLYKLSFVSDERIASITADEHFPLSWNEEASEDKIQWAEEEEEEW